ncbi:SufD family Fe-S cluster assembly protein [Sphingomonas sp. AR_OL41]|uniref:SufD family Fe-S cluster assembly protein n=1 Tax=Sphingomonas sp. AR_OL41 TaxID=3042729 RepID=UPI00248023D9|nr:SufD family Fe-S cluster assembly protein [Sphingomonas sp. AR_OL41]MDH7971985.1 SufD family Fe-S cluster assembly protein [Sphingomonas sp. AR_OL41]
MTALALPTRRDEAWRYADLAAVASVWPVPAAELIEVAAGESLTRVIVQDAALDAVAIRDFRVVLHAGATATFHVLNIGGKYGRVAIDVTCHEGSHFELGGAILGGGEQTLEIVTTLNHIQPNATSNQVVRSVLGGMATGSYLGKVAVARDAQKTDAGQSVKAMLLTRTATANAKPELEIFADDVKCAHGATVGELDAQALFYLASRGLPPAEAKALLLRAFIGSVFDGIEDQVERERVEAAAQAALERLL